jgi:hypothetical protein
VAVTVALSPAQARRFTAYRIWIAYLGVFVAFAFIREAANHTGLPVQYAYAPRLDRLLAFGRTPTEWLQRFPAWLDWPMIAVWFSFFLVPHAVAWQSFKAGTLERYAKALAIMLAVSAIAHLLLPTAPPWLSELPIRRVLEVRIHGLSADVYAFGNATAGSNPVAAMPSVHVAWVMLAGLVAGWPRWAVWGYGGAMAVSLAYLGEHFMVDAIAGGLVAWLAWRVVR